jgi:tRNA1Val (adenine37-N6)-methyltransferase
VQVKTKENKTAKRCMISFSRQVPTVVLREEICMMEADNQRSLWYRELTKDFYL